jgi:hypothetical protein
VFAVSFLCTPAAAAAEGRADGTRTGAQKPVSLVYACAQAQQGSFDPGTRDVLVILADVLLAGTSRTDPGQGGP